MARAASILRIVILAACAVAVPAAAQVPGQFSPSAPFVPAPLPPATPPAATPGLTPIPPILGSGSQSTPVMPQPVSPGRTRRPTRQDRSVACAHQGAALGVPSGSMGTYVRECLDSP